jgi:hypothetical protein
MVALTLEQWDLGFGLHQILSVENEQGSQFNFDHTHMMPIPNAALKTCPNVGHNNVFFPHNRLVLTSLYHSHNYHRPPPLLSFL